MASKPSNSRVILRGREAGGITKADIERRAREFAFIRDGHREYTEADLEAARQELSGATSPASMGEDETSDVSLIRDPSAPGGRPGLQQGETAPDENEENEDPERLAIQGVEEAQHDLMVRARERELNKARDEGDAAQ